MKSTIVRSNDCCVAGAPVDVTENKVKIPPKEAKKGPSIRDVKQGETIEIEASDSELNIKTGELIYDGKVIAIFSKTACEEIKKHHKEAKKPKDENREI